MDSVRKIARIPMGSIDRVSNMRFKNARSFNVAVLMTMPLLIAFWAKGFEKFNCHTDATNYEMKRRARRGFMPYCCVSYRFAFPKN